MKISEIPIDQLLNDLCDSSEDVAVCNTALACGNTQYSKGDIRDRLEANLGFIYKIKNEIKRRVEEANGIEA